MIKRGNKKGSHIGVMISFVIFVTFLLFMYAIIQPSISIQKDKEALSDFLKVKIINKVSYEMTAGTVSLESALGQSCVNLNGGITKLGIGTNVVVKDDSGATLNSYISSSGATDLKIQGKSTSNHLLKIYYSEAFNEAEINSLSCTALEEGEGYEIGLVKTQKYVFEKKMIELIGNYDDYAILKSELNLPEGTEFGYGIILSNGTTIETSAEEPPTNIYIKEIPIQYVDEEGNILAGYIKTKIW
jgi:uncharacterized membrane protein YcgQ (UPF0703/DUF1980 family)